MQTVSFDRRKLRTTNSNRAMQLLFSSTAGRYGLEMVALADSRGLLLVNWGDPQACDVLAAYGPLLVRTVDASERAQIFSTLSMLVPSATPGRLSVRRVSTHGEDLYLCVVGGTGATKDVALGSAASGARRILA